MVVWVPQVLDTPQEINPVVYKVPCSRDRSRAFACPGNIDNEDFPSVDLHFTAAYAYLTPAFLRL